MSLLYWLPMTDETLKNQGLSNVQPTNHGATVNNSGKLGKCYDFAGTTSQYIDTGFKESFGTGDFTITAWFKLTDSGSRTFQTIISNKTAPSASVGVAIYYNHSQQKFLWSTADGTSVTEIWMANTFSYSSNLNAWHHIAMVRNSSDSKIGYFYIDGVRYELASVPPIRNVTNNTNNMFIGSIIAPTTNYMWTGSLCDIRIYDTALSPREIKEISSALVLHYPLSREGFGADNIIPNTWPEERTFEYPTSSYRDCFSPITTIVPTASKYTLSFWAKSTVSGDKIRTHFYSPNTTTTCVSSQGVTKQASDGNMDFTLSTEWEHYWVTYSQNETTAVKHVICPRMPSGFGTGTVSIKCIKLEEGDTPTPWIPNSTDNLYTAMGLDNGIVYDTSGFGYNGTKTGVTYSSDSPRYSTSTKFNVDTDNVTPTPCFSNGQTVDEMSVSIWFKTNTLNSTAPNFFSLGENLFVRTRIATSTSIWTYSKVGAGNSNQQVYFNCKNILDNEWHHFVYVFNKGIITCYIDGEMLGSEDKSSIANYLYCGSQSWHLAGYTANGEKFIGSLSDFRIYATALSADEIADLYHTPISVSNTGTLLTQGELQE